MEVHRDLSIESKPVLLPEVNEQIIIQTFLLGGQTAHPILTKGTTGDGTDPPSFWLQPFGSVSKCKFFQWWHHQGGLATTFEVWAKQLFQAVCQVKFTSVDPVEPPKGNKSGPTPQPMRGDVAGDDPPLPPPRSE